MKTATLCLFLFLVSPALLAEDPAWLAVDVDALAQPYLDGQIVNALSIGVVAGDQTWTRHYGELSENSKSAPGDATIYEIGSITKVFTGILLADAVLADRVRLDQPIGQLLPELQKQNPTVGESIQLWHLSTHVSGLPRLPGNMSPADPGNPYADYDRQRMFEFMVKVQPKRKPGEQFEYSNLAVGLLGQLLALQAELSYEDLLRQKILTPLEMNDSGVTLNDQQGRLAPPHDADRVADKNWDLNSFAGAGGIRSTTSDMLKFIKAQLHPPQDQLGQAIELAWQQHLPSKGDAFAIGLGWHIAHDGQTRWHNGQTGGYHSILFVDRSIDAGVILLSNTASGQTDALAESIMRSIAGGEIEPQKFPKPK